MHKAFACEENGLTDFGLSVARTRDLRLHGAHFRTLSARCTSPDPGKNLLMYKQATNLKNVVSARDLQETSSHAADSCIVMEKNVLSNDYDDYAIPS